MTAVDHGCTRKGVMEVLQMTFLCMWTMEMKLYLYRRCVGNNQGDGDQCDHRLGFNTRQGMFKGHNSNQDHE